MTCNACAELGKIKGFVGFWEAESLSLCFTSQAAEGAKNDKLLL